MKKILNNGFTKSLLATSLLLGLSACNPAEEETATENLNNSQIPKLTIHSLEIESSGAQITWNVSVDSEYTNTELLVYPVDDNSYTIQGQYSDDFNSHVSLGCNKEVAGAGYVSCNDVDSIQCTRVMMGSDYSDFTCDYTIKGGAYVFQFLDKMRVATLSRDNQEEVLVNVGFNFPDYDYSILTSDASINSDESKMYNVYTNGIGQLQ